MPLMTSTPDYSMSPIVYMHSRLIRLGVAAELHIFEGLRHGECPGIAAGGTRDLCVL